MFHISAVQSRHTKRLREINLDEELIHNNSLLFHTNKKNKIKAKATSEEIAEQLNKIVIRGTKSKMVKKEVPLGDGDSNSELTELTLSDEEGKSYESDDDSD